MQKSINDILKENKKLIEKQQEENKKAISLFKKVFNTEDGEKVLEYLEKYVKKPTDLNNPNANYGKFSFSYEKSPSYWVVIKSSYKEEDIADAIKQFLSEHIK